METKIKILEETKKLPSHTDAEPEVDIKELQIETFQQFREVLNRRWSPKYTLKTAVSYDDFLKTKIRNKILYDTSDTKTVSKSTKRILYQYPDLEEGEDLPCRGGSFKSLDLQSVAHTATGVKKYSNKVILAKSQQTGQGQANLENLFYLMMDTIKHSSPENGNGDLAIMQPNGIELDTFRKMIEVLTKDLNTAVTVIGARRPRKKEPQQRKTSNLNKIIISGPGSYSDIVKTIKNSVQNVEQSKMIKGIRKTKGGSVLLNTNGDPKAFSDFMTRANKDLRIINPKKQTMTLNVKGLDCITTLGDVKETIIQSNLLANPEDFSMKSLRPTAIGNQIATIATSLEDGKKVLKERSLKIGLTECWFQERISVTQCFKCWEFGHKTNQCHNPTDRSKLCLNCGKPGHMAKQCNDNKHCPLCQEDGHSVGNGSCKRFQVELKKIRQMKKAASTHSNDVIQHSSN